MIYSNFLEKISFLLKSKKEILLLSKRSRSCLKGLWGETPAEEIVLVWECSSEDSTLFSESYHMLQQQNRNKKSAPTELKQHYNITTAKIYNQM